MEKLYYYYDDPSSLLKIRCKIGKCARNTENLSFFGLTKLFSKEFVVDKFVDDGKFIDSTFPPDIKSIFGENKNEHCDIKWVRAEELSKTDTLFEEISPSVVKQGHMGNCWFIASLCCLAERPKFVEKIFSSGNLSTDGSYRLKLFKNGEAVEVKVDSLIPVRKDDGLPFGAHSKNGAMWLPLIEKAYAKLHGSYNSLISGQCHEAFMDLTGCPSNELIVDKTTDETQLFEWFRERANKNNFLISVGINGKIEGHEKARMMQKGLITDHAYSLVDAQEHFGKDKKLRRLVQLRNPWSSFEWNGDFSDNSSKWTDKLKREFHLCVDKNDGLFWLKFSDFLSLFDVFSYCDLSKNWQIKSIPFVFTRKQDDVENLSFKVKVPKGARLACASVHQTDKRIPQSSDYIDVAAFILKSGKSVYEKHRAITFLDSELDRCTLKNLDLGEGVYRIIPYSSGAHFDVGSSRKSCLMLHYYNENESGEENPRPAKALGVTNINYKREVTDKAQISLLDEMQTETSRKEGIFSIHIMKLGGLVLFGMKNHVKDKPRIGYEVNVSKSRNFFPAVDSWQKKKVQYFETNGDSAGQTILLGSFVRKNDDACHFAANVRYNIFDKAAY